MKYFSPQISTDGHRWIFIPESVFICGKNTIGLVLLAKCN